MANYFYVKSGGTLSAASDTPYSSEQSGSFATLGASNYYATLGDAVSTSKATPPTAGDFIMISDAHSASYDNGGSPLLAGVSSGAPLRLISVSDTNCDTYSTGASDNLSDTGDDYSPSGTVGLFGMVLETGDNILQLVSTDGILYAQDCVLQADQSGDTIILANQDGWLVNFFDVTVDANNSAALFCSLNHSCHVHMVGGSISTITKLASGGFAAGGGLLSFTGVDMTSITTLVDSLSSSTDKCYITLNQCKINTALSLPVPQTDLFKSSHRVEMYNCDDGTSDTYHRFYIASGSGTASNNDATYVTATESWYEGSDKSSVEITTSSICTFVNPFVFDLPAQYVDLGDVSTDVISVELLYDSNDITLNDADIAAFLVYPDGTTKVQPNWVTSSSSVVSGSYAIDPLASGAALTASTLTTGSWTESMTTPAVARLKLDTSGDPGEATAVSIRIEVYKASIAAGDLFIHPILVVAGS